MKKPFVPSGQLIRAIPAFHRFIHSLCQTTIKRMSSSKYRVDFVSGADRLVSCAWRRRWQGDGALGRLGSWPGNRGLEGYMFGPRVREVGLRVNRLGLF